MAKKLVNMLLLLIISLILIPDGIYSKPHSDFLAEEKMHPKFTRSDSHLKVGNEKENKAMYWKNLASQTIREKLSKKLNEGVAKNVILFLGDGMSIPTVAATRLYQGKDENFQLSFEKFPHSALSKTYCIDKQVADSACTATAYLAGVKGNYETIGVTADVIKDDCIGMNYGTNQVKSIAYHSQRIGKSTGFVTTARVTDASPAGVYAHTANRDWETDADVIAADQDPDICIDIAKQLIEWEVGRNLKVIMGGGRKNFLPNTTRDEDGKKGGRLSEDNLIELWLNNTSGSYVGNRSSLLQLDLSTTDHLLGLFSRSHMDYNVDRDTEKQPSLTEMTEAAVKILSKNPEGFFLFVEGALIDKAHHDAKARKSLDETVEFAKAIQRAVELTSEEDTLIVVTADHAHTMSISGYPVRGNDILGIGGDGTDNLPFTTLTYANGPGFTKKRVNVSSELLLNKDFQYSGGFPLDSESHGGDDVAIYARGPWAHLFSGVIEQHVIPHVMAYASCVGELETVCDRVGPGGSTVNIPDGAINSKMSTSLALLVVVMYIYHYL